VTICFIAAIATFNFGTQAIAKTPTEAEDTGITGTEFIAFALQLGEDRTPSARDVGFLEVIPTEPRAEVKPVHWLRLSHERQRQHGSRDQAECFAVHCFLQIANPFLEKTAFYKGCRRFREKIGIVAS
jgi:hypothetical protein